MCLPGKGSIKDQNNHESWLASRAATRQDSVEYCCSSRCTREKERERKREKVRRTKGGRKGGHACAHVREISRSRAMNSVTRAATHVPYAGTCSVRKLPSVEIRRRIEGNQRKAKESKAKNSKNPN